VVQCAVRERGELRHFSELLRHTSDPGLGLHAEVRVGLQVNFFHAAWSMKVVDVGNTPRGRQRVVDVREREAKRRAFLLIPNFKRLLRRIVDTVRTHLGEHGTLRRHAEELIARREELVVDRDCPRSCNSRSKPARVAKLQAAAAWKAKTIAFVDPPERANRAAGDSQRFRALTLRTSQGLSLTKARPMCWPRSPAS